MRINDLSVNYLLYGHRVQLHPITVGHFKEIREIARGKLVHRSSMIKPNSAEMKRIFGDNFLKILRKEKMRRSHTRVKWMRRLECDAAGA